MISVNVKFIGSNVKSFEVKGHALFAPYGQDLVCAGVSAVVIGGFNALEKYVNDKSVELIQKESELKVDVIKDNETIQTILNTILVQLQTIESSYQKNIKITIKRGGVWNVIKVKFTILRI